MHSVGPPQPGITVRLEAIPSMDYDPLGIPPRGEILIKGDAVFKGYYRNEVSRPRRVNCLCGRPSWLATTVASGLGMPRSQAMARLGGTK